MAKKLLCAAFVAAFIPVVVAQGFPCDHTTLIATCDHEDAKAHEDHEEDDD